MEKCKPSAYSTAVACLARRSHSENELRQKLLRKEFPASEIAAALERCKGFGYLDDATLILSLSRQFAVERQLGKIAIAQKLAGKGFSRELIQDALERLDELESVLPEEVRAKQLLRKKFRSEILDVKGKAKACRFLQSRGFSWSVIGSVMGDLDS